MKKYILASFLLCFFESSAQKEFDNWYFGDSAAISFVSGSPADISQGSLYTKEGCSSISTAAGVLLFYTDGSTVYNRNGITMPNGTGLFGGNSASQSALITPDPTDINKYYVFTVAETGGANGFCYSRVDMTLAGGLGDVTLKNMPLLTPADEKLTAVRNANGSGYWVLVHKLSSPTSNSYYAYPVTASGIGTPVISVTGTYHNTPSPFIGYLKVSPDGKKIANTLYGMGQVEIGDFNNSTGVVSNTFTVAAPGTGNVYPYGIEFSATGDRLYCSCSDVLNMPIFQLDMRAGSNAAIAASLQTISIKPVRNGALQIASNNKIYVARTSTTYLGVINDPDSLGVKCNYVDTGFHLSREARIGLPNFFTMQFVALPKVQFTASDSSFCNESGQCIDFTDLTTNNPTSWKWSFPGAAPDTSTQQNPTNICYSTPGTYAVKLIVSNSHGSDSITISPMITFASAPALPVLTFSGDTIFCSHAATYQWYLDGLPIPFATDSFYVIAGDGVYSVLITDGNGCSRLSNGFPVSISELNGADRIKIYPNPAGDQFMIYDSRFTIGKNAVIEIYDALGEKVLSTPLNTKQQTINCKLLAKGIYFVRINGSAEVIRLMKIN